MKQTKVLFISFATIMSPFMTYAAATEQQGDNIKNLLGKLLHWIDMGGKLLMAVIFLAFLFGLFKLIRSSADDKVKEAKGAIGWNLLALVAMAGVWAAVNSFLVTFGLDKDSEIVNLPKTPWVHENNNNNGN